MSLVRRLVDRKPVVSTAAFIYQRVGRLTCISMDCCCRLSLPLLVVVYRQSKHGGPVQHAGDNDDPLLCYVDGRCEARVPAASSRWIMRQYGTHSVASGDVQVHRLWCRNNNYLCSPTHGSRNTSYKIMQQK